MNHRPPRTLRRLKLAIGALLLSRALLAMYFSTVEPTNWPIDARPCTGLRRATKQILAAAAGALGACDEREIAFLPSSGDSA